MFSPKPINPAIPMSSSPVPTLDPEVETMTEEEVKSKIEKDPEN